MAMTTTVAEIAAAAAAMTWERGDWEADRFGEVEAAARDRIRGLFDDAAEVVLTDDEPDGDALDLTAWV